MHQRRVCTVDDIYMQDVVAELLIQAQSDGMDP
jgi:hypothetical protein